MSDIIFDKPCWAAVSNEDVISSKLYTKEHYARRGIESRWDLRETHKVVEVVVTRAKEFDNSNVSVDAIASSYQEGRHAAFVEVLDLVNSIDGTTVSSRYLLQMVLDKIGI